MSEQKWLQRRWVDAIHYQQLQRFGGLFGVRDAGAIDAALARPRNRWEDTDDVDLPGLAAAYGFALTRTHGYVDGNKRIGFMAMAIFLDLNDWRLSAPEPEVVQVMVAVAAGEMTEAELADWVRRYSEPGPASAS